MRKPLAPRGPREHFPLPARRGCAPHANYAAANQAQWAFCGPVKSTTCSFLSSIRLRASPAPSARGIGRPDITAACLSVRTSAGRTLAANIGHPKIGYMAGLRRWLVLRLLLARDRASYGLSCVTRTDTIRSHFRCHQPSPGGTRRVRGPSTSRACPSSGRSSQSRRVGNSSGERA